MCGYSTKLRKNNDWQKYEVYNFSGVCQFRNKNDARTTRSKFEYVHRCSIDESYN